MKTVHSKLLTAGFMVAAAAALCSADTFATYGDAQVVTGPDGQPAWQLTSNSAGPNTYSGMYVQISGPLTPTTLTTLSADYVMLTGTFGGGAPRFSLWDNSNNEAWIYFGTPTSGGSFTDPNQGNTNYANTGNYADATSPDVRVYSNGFGGYGNGNTGQTWAEFLADPGVSSTQIAYISLDLDGGFTGNQVMDTTNFDINGTTYSPSSATPEPAALALSGCGLLLAGAFRRLRKRNS